MNLSLQDGQSACFSHDGLFFEFPTAISERGSARGKGADQSRCGCMAIVSNGTLLIVLGRQPVRREALLLPQGCLVMLDHIAHRLRIAFAVAMAQDGVAAARGINAYV